jgi:hypothetical protein
MQLFDLFVEYGAWSWLIVGLVLLGLELMLPGGVFLWLGISAIVTGFIRFVFPLDFPHQVGVFGILGVMSILFWLRVARRYGNLTAGRSGMSARKWCSTNRSPMASAACRSATPSGASPGPICLPAVASASSAMTARCCGWSRPRAASREAEPGSTALSAAARLR